MCIVLVSNIHNRLFSALNKIPIIAHICIFLMDNHFTENDLASVSAYSFFILSDSLIFCIALQRLLTTTFDIQTKLSLRRGVFAWRIGFFNALQSHGPFNAEKCASTSRKSNSIGRLVRLSLMRCLSWFYFGCFKTPSFSIFLCVWWIICVCWIYKIYHSNQQKQTNAYSAGRWTIYRWCAHHSKGVIQKMDEIELFFPLPQMENNSMAWICQRIKNQWFWIIKQCENICIALVILSSRGLNYQMF